MVAVSGLGSGLDIDGLVTGLVNAERVPQQNRLLNREQTATNLISAFGQLQGVLSSLQSKLSPLQSRDTFTQISSSSSQSSAVGVSSDSTAAVGTYDVSVQSLSNTQSFASTTFAAPDTVVGTGTLTLSFGTPTYSGGDPDTYTAFAADAERDPVPITIDGTNNTLEGVRDAINNAEAGVTASLVKDGDQYRLLLSTEETGVANSLALTVTGDGDGFDTDASGLSALAFDATTSNLTQTRAAADANFTINGLALTSPTDTVTNVLDGVTLTLKKVTESDATINVSENRGAITTAISEFVETYNEYVNTSDNLTSFDSEANLRGPLQGDFSARSIRSQLRTTLSAPPDFDTGTFNALAQIGISVGRDGDLSLNTATLNEAIDTDPESVIAIFADTEVNGVTRDGLASRLDTVLENIVGSSGLIDSRTDGLNDTISRIQDDRQVLNERMEALEARFRIQFNALDALLANITTTGDFLQQQLDNLPGYSSGRD